MLKLILRPTFTLFAPNFFYCWYTYVVLITCKLKLFILTNLKPSFFNFEQKMFSPSETLQTKNRMK